MKTTKQIFILIVLCVSTFAAKGQLYIKNSSAKTIRVCLGWYQDNDGYYMTRGWYDIEPGQTVDPQIKFSSAKDFFYYHAITKDKKENWGGDYKFLISSEPFSIKYADKAETKEENPNYYLASFVKKQMDFGMFDTWTYTLNLTIEDETSQSISGTYAYEDENYAGSVVVNDLGNKQFTFSISVGSKAGCTGDISGTATMGASGTGKYSGEGCKSLTFVFSGKKLSVTENECSDMHGMNCFFSGDYLKK